VPTRSTDAELAANLPWGSACLAAREMRKGAHQLGRRKRLPLQGAARHTFRCPFVRRHACHIDNRQIGTDFTRRFCDGPAVQSSTQLHISDERSEFASLANEQGERLFTGREGNSVKTGFAENILDKSLDRQIVFDDEDN
jgi:hypothetical protein